MDDTPRPAPRSRGIYLLPNLLTTCGMFSGFYAILAAADHRFENACMAVFIAAIFDGVDGRIARLTGTSTEFGVQYDSLADLVSFGMAPALVMYHWALSTLKFDGVAIGKAGWAASFLYAACAALRLARFNTQVGVVDKRWFQGLPSPAAAALVMGFIWLVTESGKRGGEVLYLSWVQITWITFGFTLYSGLTMVTNAPFYSFKDFRKARSVPFAAIVLIALGIAAINIDPPTVLFSLFVIYGLSGYVVYAWRKAKGQPVSVISISTDEPDEVGLHK